MIKTVLCDIEGTTTSISFVHDELFPLSLREMENFLKQSQNRGDVSAQLDKLAVSLSKQQGRVAPITTKELADYFCGLIKNDIKDTLLKKIQGMIWRDAYEAGGIRGHVYEDVKPSWQAWTNAGLSIAIYSSGSIEAQKLIFGYSKDGDLTQYISHYFDTTTGPKKEPASYTSIAKSLGLLPSEILFLSDSTQELAAAKQAGMAVVCIVRPPLTIEAKAPFLQAVSFLEIDPSSAI